MNIDESILTEKISEEQKEAIENLPDISDIIIISRINIGYSGALVFIVDVKSTVSHGPTGRHILKIDHAGPGDLEKRNHEEAYQTDINKYMADLVSFSYRNDRQKYVAILYSLAHNTLLDSRLLCEHIAKNFPDAVNQLSNLTEILHGWNSKSSICHEYPNKLLENSLGSLLKGEKSIQNIARKTFGINEKYESIAFEGSKYFYPNPIAYVLRLRLWKDVSRKIAWPCGYVHFDLHSANIICPLKKDDKTPILIDFMKYRKEFLTFFDYAYLEFDLLLRMMPPNTENNREEWFDFGNYLARDAMLFKTFNGSAIAQSAQQIVKPIYDAVNDIAEFEKQQDDFKLAYLIAGIVACLNWFRKLNDDYEKTLALLLSSQRLEVLLEYLDIKVTKGRTTMDIRWFCQKAETQDNTIKETSHRLRTDLSPILFKSGALLVLGPGVSRWLGLPSELSLSQSVARELKCSLPDTGLDSDDPACFDQLVRNKPDEILDNIKVSVAENYKPITDIQTQVETKLTALAQVKWLAIIDWSFSPLLFRSMSKFLASQKKIFPIMELNDIIKINLGNTMSIPWIFLRGTIEESKGLVLGNQEWRLTKNKRFREKAIEKLLRTGTQVKDTFAIFIGCKGRILSELYNLTQSFYHNKLHTWAIDEEIEKDSIAQNLNEAEGLHLVSLSPIMFCDFLNLELPPIIKRNRDIERYVMELKGIEIERDENKNITSVRQAENGHEDIVELPIPEDKMFELKNYLEILYRGIELDTISGYIPGGDFYRGHKITWKDLALGYDIQRNIKNELIDILISDLNEQIPRRIHLSGEPGAGLTTLVARLAWDIYKIEKIPVVFVRRADMIEGLTDSIFHFRDYVNRSFLLIAEAEYIEIEYADLLFEKLQSKHVPAIMLLVGQVENKQIRSFYINTDTSGEDSKQKRTFTLFDELTSDERSNLQDKLFPFVPDSNREKFTKCYDSSLFINLLTAFEEKFIRLPHMVGKYLEGIDKTTQELLAAIAYCNRYGHMNAPLGFLATITNLSEFEIRNRVKPLIDRLIIAYIENDDIEVNYSCRHDLISFQIICTLWSIGPLRDSWKNRLVDITIGYIEKFGQEKKGNEWQRKFVTNLVSGDFSQIRIRVSNKYRVSRLMNDIDNSAGRGRIFETAADIFDDEPHLIAQYGRFLYDEDMQFEKAREYLHIAFDLTDSKDSSICHMLGMSFRRELYEYLKPILRRKPDQAQYVHINYLYENAAKYFKRSRELNRENEYGYVSHIECLVDIIKHGFSQFGKDTPNHKRLSVRDDLQKYLQDAFGIIDEAKVYFEFSRDSLLGKCKDDLIFLQGDLREAIKAYTKLLSNGRRYEQRDLIQIKRSLAGCLFQIGIENLKGEYLRIPSSVLNDFRQAASYFDELIQNQQSQPNHLYKWFECARIDPHMNKIKLIERLETYYNITDSLIGAFYLMCLYFARGLEEGNPTAFRTYRKYLEDCQRLSANLTGRLNIREWLGTNFNIIPRDHVNFESEGDGLSIQRLEGKIKRIFGRDGEISIPPYGETIYFRAKRYEKKFYKSDEEKSVSFYIAFTYDKPIAYNVIKSGGA